jgi:hypothetical protein
MYILWTGPNNLPEFPQHDYLTEFEVSTQKSWKSLCSLTLVLKVTEEEGTPIPSYSG